MNKPYIKRFQKFSKQLFNAELSKYARISNSYTFTRNRKMSLKDILLCYLAKKELTTVFELRNYFQQKETSFIKNKNDKTRLFTTKKTSKPTSFSSFK